MHNNSTLTWVKGIIGTAPPFYALLFHVDAWAAPVQVCLGAIVPTLMGISLIFDIKKKWRENNESDRQDQIREERKAHFRRKHYAKKLKNRTEGITDNPSPDLLQ